MAGSWIFYTTFPKIPLINPEFKNIAQFAPPLGFLIGTIQSYIFLFLTTNSWSIYASALICLASGYLITGGLHIDGLMDTFDGIFAGKKKRLKAMKDSKVGSFGVQALVFITLIQIACILKIQNLIIFVLPICLFWGRFSNLFFIEKFKYMSYKKKSFSHKKFWNGFKKESLISIIFLLILNKFNQMINSMFLDEISRHFPKKADLIRLMSTLMLLLFKISVNSFSLFR